MAGLYLVSNGAVCTTAASVVVTTGTAIKTMLQIKPFQTVKIVEYGVCFDGSAAATPIKVELLETGTVFGTVTALADADIDKLESSDQTDASVAGLTLGTSATGFTCTSEGSITTTRKLYAPQLVAPTNQYIREFSPGRQPRVFAGKCGRIRVTAGAAVNAYCWMILEL